MNTRLPSWPLWILSGFLFLQGCKPIVPPSNQPPSPPISTATLTLTLTETLTDNGAATSNIPVEFTIDGIPTATNPFDAAEVDLHINLVGPNGITTTVGGFWDQSYTPDGTQPVGEPGWRARFTPTIIGDWHASAHLQPSGISSNQLTFSVVEGTTPGFIRIDPDNPRFFAYDDGKRFLPLGVNMGWWDDNPIENYTRWLDHFAANGGNTIRVWMASWAFALEWNDTPLGDYRARMRQAWLLDELFRLASERGVKVILVLNHHGQFSRTVNPQWSENPYNAELGGPLVAPEQFASDPIAMALFQQRLRYIVDRWSAAPNLLAWEWWNEYNFTPITDTQMEPWLQEMETFLAARDPYNHLVTISGPAGAASPIWQLPGIDFVSIHVYTPNDPLQVVTELTQEYASVVDDKPLLLAEFGFATGEEGIDSFDKTGIHLHNGLWATIFSGQAGSGMYWWWDTYLEPLGLWHHFGSLSKFLESLDLAQFVPVVVSIVADNPKGAGAEGLLLEGADQRLLWVRNNQYTAAAVDEAYNAALRNALRNKEKLEEYIYTPSPVGGLSVHINGVASGSYAVHWFDPQTGTWGAVEQIEAIEGSLAIPLPSFRQDIAAKITPLP